MIFTMTKAKIVDQRKEERKRNKQTPFLRIQQLAVEPAAKT